MTDKSYILVASSDPKIREMGRQSCEAEGYQVLLCGDGEEAQESIKKFGSKGDIRLLVLEAFLPKMDGYDLVRQIESESPLNKIPVLMILDRDGFKTKTAATKLRLYADEYLQKPFDAAEIQGQIHSLTKHFRKHAAPHPVTGLPGHPQMEQEIFLRMAKGEDLAMVCFDINHFRPFNDHYGTDKGNAVIKKLVDLIRKELEPLESQAPKPFFAHVDGDDFIVLVPREKAEALRQALRQKFQEEAARFYGNQDAEKGFFRGKDRENKERVFPFMTLASAVLPVAPQRFPHYGELVIEMNEALRQAKIGSQEVH